MVLDLEGRNHEKQLSFNCLEKKTYQKSESESPSLYKHGPIVVNA